MNDIIISDGNRLNHFQYISKHFKDNFGKLAFSAELAWLIFGPTRRGGALQTHYFRWLFCEQIHKIVQYLSVLQTFETWVKHCCQKCSTNICDYYYDFLCHFIIKGENTTRTKTWMLEYNICNVNVNMMITWTTSSCQGVIISENWNKPHKTSYSCVIFSYLTPFLTIPVKHICINSSWNSIAWKTSWNNIVC